MRIGEAKNDTDLVAALEEAKERRKDLRRGFETVWWNNIALVAGDHYARWDPNLGRFEDRVPFDDSLEGKKPRLVVNHALTVGRTELAKLTKAHPIMDIMANSDEPIDIGAAKVGRSALDYAEWKFKLRKKRKNALWWMIQTGLGAVYVGWDHLDAKQGFMEFVIDPATSEPAFDPSRVRELQDMLDNGELDEGELKKHVFPLGDVDYKVYSPFQLLPDETKTELDEIQDLITTDVEDVDVVMGLYGEKDLKPESNLKLGVIEERMMALAGVAGGIGAKYTTVESGIEVNTYWLLPGMYPGNKYLANGKMLRWVKGRKILDISKTFPFQDARMPFVWLQHVPTSAVIWPDSIMSHIRGPNLEIDKTVSQLIENKDYMANPMWRIATQHKIKGEVKNVAGAIVRYRHVPNIPPPEPVPGLQMPSQVENIVMALRDQILDISGQSEVARGRVPSGVRSGVAVAYLQEEDDTKIAPTIENFEDAIALMGSLTLERFSQFYTFERIIRFYRRDGIFDVRKFKGADLKNNTDVVCQSGSAMPRMKAARHQYVLELVSLGILKDPKKIQEMLEIGEGEPDDVDKAISQANRENNVMLHGVWAGQTAAAGESNTEAMDKFNKLTAAIPVKSWHNHQVHVSRHTSVMMDEEFDRLSITNPEVVRLFDEHLAMHQQELAKQQAEQMKQLMAAKGAPDGPPTPPGGGNGGPAAGPDAQLQSLMNVGDVIGGGRVQTRAVRSTK
jgi:hypothetical protein